MKVTYSVIKRFLSEFRLNLARLRGSSSILKTNWYEKNQIEFLRQKGKDDTFQMGNAHPIVYDRQESAGELMGHYFHQDLFVAQCIHDNGPIKHLDIGSRIDGFVAHVAAFREIELLDIRPFSRKIKNVEFRQVDLMNLPSELINYCDSISSLHAIEHFGLGRYGDPIDYFGYIKALDNIYLMLKPQGKFYFSTPIGPQRIEFNAHRVFSVKYLVDLFSERYHIEAFSYENDQGQFHPNVELNDEGIINNFGCHYGCGIFQLRKK